MATKMGKFNFSTIVYFAEVPIVPVFKAINKPFWVYKPVHGWRITVDKLWITH